MLTKKRTFVYISTFDIIGRKLHIYGQNHHP